VMCYWTVALMHHYLYGGFFSNHVLYLVMIPLSPLNASQTLNRALSIQKGV